MNRLHSYTFGAEGAHARLQCLSGVGLNDGAESPRHGGKPVRRLSKRTPRMPKSRPARAVNQAGGER